MTAIMTTVSFVKRQVTAAGRRWGYYHESLSIVGAEALAKSLCDSGIKATAYHAQLTPEEIDRLVGLSPLVLDGIDPSLYQVEEPDRSEPSSQPLPGPRIDAEASGRQLSHLLRLAKRGAKRGASGGEQRAFRLVKAIEEDLDGLDPEAMAGVGVLVALFAADPQSAAKQLQGGVA